jgi:hypothetical protein
VHAGLGSAGVCEGGEHCDRAMALSAVHVLLIKAGWCLRGAYGAVQHRVLLGWAVGWCGWASLSEYLCSQVCTVASSSCPVGHVIAENEFCWCLCAVLLGQRQVLLLLLLPAAARSAFHEPFCPSQPVCCALV